MNQTTLRVAVLFSFVLLVVSIIWMGAWRSRLVIPGKTNALYSLEITWSKQRVQEVLGYWQDRIADAKALNNVDFLLILGFGSFFYSSFLLLAIRFPTFYGQFIRVFLRLTLLAVLLDVLEGVAIHYWLRGHLDSVSPVLVSISAILKFLIVIPLALLIVLGYLALLQRIRKE